MKYKVSLNSEDNFSSEFDSFNAAYRFILRALKIVEANDSEVRKIALSDIKTKIEVIKPENLRDTYAVIQETSS